MVCLILRQSNIKLILHSRILVDYPGFKNVRLQTECTGGVTVSFDVMCSKRFGTKVENISNDPKTKGIMLGDHGRVY